MKELRSALTYALIAYLMFTLMLFLFQRSMLYYPGDFKPTPEMLAEQNLRVVLAEYPGYGGRDGKPDESTLVSDGVETLRLAYQAYGEPLYL